MAAMGISLLIYAGIAYLSGDPIILFQGVYSFPKGKKEKTSVAATPPSTTSSTMSKLHAN